MSTSFTVTDENLSFFFGEVLPHLDERQRRIITGAAARALGHGGVKAAAVASGLSLSTVQNGALAVDAGLEPSDRVRAPGAGRKPAEKSMPGLEDALDKLVEPGTRGDPECALRWTTKSTRTLADELTKQGFKVTHSVVAKLLTAMGYSLQAARKSAEGSDHPDRDAQFRYLAGLVERFRAAGEPVISVDAKKKELIGNFAPTGQQWRPAGQPVETNTHDFPDPELGKAVPYGVYDVASNAGWVSVGGSSDTAEFAVATIRRWWTEVGAAAYPDATTLLITADSGGSNSSRGRLWKKRDLVLRQRRRTRRRRVPLPTRDIEVEQNRTPLIQSHLHELARPCPGESRGGGEPDRRHHNPNRTDRPSRTRSHRLPKRDQSNRP
jgi:transposase